MSDIKRGFKMYLWITQIKGVLMAYIIGFKKGLKVLDIWFLISYTYYKRYKRTRKNKNKTYGTKTSKRNFRR